VRRLFASRVTRKVTAEQPASRNRSSFDRPSSAKHGSELRRCGSSCCAVTHPSSLAGGGISRSSLLSRLPPADSLIAERSARIRQTMEAASAAECAVKASSAPAKLSRTAAALLSSPALAAHSEVAGHDSARLPLRHRSMRASEASPLGRHASSATFRTQSLVAPSKPVDDLRRMTGNI